jgi:hypothetical protein
MATKIRPAKNWLGACYNDNAWQNLRASKITFLGTVVATSGLFRCPETAQTAMFPNKSANLYNSDAYDRNSRLACSTPLSAARETSPALRLSLTAAKDGISITFVKRRGPQRDEPLFVPLAPSPVLLSRHASLDRRASAAPRPRVVSPALANVSPASSRCGSGRAPPRA